MELPNDYTKAIQVYFKDELQLKTTPSLRKCEQFLEVFHCEKNKKQVQDKIRSLNKSK